VPFYKRFIKEFNTITPLITECLKLETFKWTAAAHKTFLGIKQRIIEAPMLWNFNLSDIFEVTCDAWM